MNTHNKSLKQTLIPITLAFFAGLLNVLGYAPFDLWHLSFVALIILCILLSQESRSAKSAFLIVFTFAAASNFGSLFWIHRVLQGFGQMPILLVLLVLIIFACYLAIFPAVAGLISQIMCKRHQVLKTQLIFPILWTVGESINSWLFTGFPWNSIAYTQITSWFSNLAPLIGALGITWVLLITSASLALLIVKRQVIYIIMPVCLAGLMVWLGSIAYTDNLTPVKVALIQGNIPTETKWNPELIAPTFKTYFDLLDKNKDAQLVVWPESAIPVLENNAISILTSLDREMSQSNTSLITGIQYYDEHKKEFYNGVIGLGVMDHQNSKHYVPGESNRYYKRHLVPIGEFVPFETLLRMLGPIFNMPMSSFTRGPEKQPNIVADGLNIATAICYEIIFSSEMRKQVNEDTNLIVTVSNDGWFNRTNGPFQHLNIARMRAMEFRKPVLRATNNGITAIIDSTGHVTETIPQNMETVLKGEVVPTVGCTPYARFGELPIWICFTIIFIYFLAKKLGRIIYILLARFQNHLFRRIDQEQRP